MKLHELCPGSHLDLGPCLPPRLGLPMSPTEVEVWNVQTLLSLDTLVLLSGPDPYGTAECYGSLEGNPRPARVGSIGVNYRKAVPSHLPWIAVYLVQHDVCSSYTMKSTKIPALCCCYVGFRLIFPLVTMNESSDESVEMFAVSGSTSQCWLKLQREST